LDPSIVQAAAQVIGVPKVIDTATLLIDGQTIQLAGVVPEDGWAAKALARYLRRRELTCTAGSSTANYACTLDDQDLAMTILSNGGASATADASPALKAAVETARASHLGIWR
jgi:penicillin-binding protein 1A